MHEYASNANDRETVPRRLLVPTVTAALVVTWLVELLKAHIPVLRDYGWIIDVSSAPFFYDLFRNWFDTDLWRRRIGWRRWSEIPDLNGTWIGTGRSSYRVMDGTRSAPFQAVVTINQTWSKICVELQTKGSVSKSIMAALNTSHSTEPGLLYEYINSPRYFRGPDLNPETMQIHRGVVHLCLSADGKTLAGDYYTDPRRNNFGSLDLHYHCAHPLNHEETIAMLEPPTTAVNT